jgi:hypothetical protein
MDEQSAPLTLEEAMQPYLDKGYQIVNSTDTSAELFRPKKKMGWWIAVWDTGGYARNHDRTAYFTVAETGEIQITGDTLDKLKSDERADKGVKFFRLAILIIFLGIICLCVFCLFGGMFFQQ